MEIPTDTPALPTDAASMPDDALVMPAGNGRGKLRLLTRESLDGRTRARKQFDAIAEAIAPDFGDERMSTIRRHLTEAFAVAALQVSNMETTT